MPQQQDTNVPYLALMLIACLWGALHFASKSKDEGQLRQVVEQGQ